MKYRFHIFVACLFLLLGGIIYSNGLHGPFMGDDHIFFNERMSDIRFLKYQFLPDRAYYRPLANIVPMLCHLAFGENTFGYHVFNLALFCLTAFSICAFISALFSDPQLGFLTGLFYLVHPINGIIVNYVTASVFPVQAICMLLSLFFLTKKVAATFLGKGSCYLFSVLFFVLALLCHETAMALPLYAVCLLVFVEDMSWKNAFKKCIPLWLVLAGYILFHFKYASFNKNIFEQIGYFHIGFGQYLATFARIISWYLSKLIFLSGIVLAWSTPVLQERAGLWLLVFCLLFAGFAGAAVHYRKNKPALLGLSWLLIGFAPVTLSCLSQPTQGFFIEPHWFVFSSIGFFLFLAYAVKKISLPAIKIPVLLVLLLAWSFACRGYNYIWSDEERYDLYWMHEAPDYKVPDSFLARVYFIKNDLNRARYYYLKCIEHTYADHLFYANLGLIDSMQGDWKSAKKYYAMALSIEPHMSEVLTNLGIMALKENNVKLAKDDFTRAMQADSFAKAPRLNMAHLLGYEGDTDGAIKMYRSILEITPYDEDALVPLLKIYWDRKDDKQVVAIARELAAHSKRALTQYNLAIIFHSLDLDNESHKAFDKARKYEH